MTPSTNPTRPPSTAPLARPTSFSLDGFARVTGLHPDLVLRLVQLGLLDATRDSRGQLRFSVRDVRQVDRIERLRLGLSLNYAALGLVIDLLDRIDRLESALRRRPGAREETTRPWT